MSGSEVQLAVAASKCVAPLFSVKPATITFIVLALVDFIFIERHVGGRPQLSVKLVLSILIGAVLLLVTGVEACVVPGRLPGSPMAWTVGGLCLAALGLPIRAWAVKSNPSFNYSEGPSVDIVIATRGPYRWIRHPGYAGLIMLIGGMAIAIGSWSLCAVTSAALVDLMFLAGREERV
ncbi:MAG: methyltransferase family protein, partial [Acetobacteraceae bacterium]